MWSESFAASSLQIIFQRFTTWPNLVQNILGTAKGIFLLQKPPSDKFQAFSLCIVGMQALQKEKVHQDVIQNLPLNSQKSLEQGSSIVD